MRMKSAKKKAFLVEVLRFLVLAVISVVFLYPFVFMVLKSLDEMANYGLKFPPGLLPEKWGMKNYMTSMALVNIGKYYINTLIVTFWAVILHLASSAMAGYAISKGRFRFKRFWLVFILSTMMIPSEAILLTRFLMFKNVGLVDTYIGLILPTLAYPMGVFLSKQFMDSLPDTLGEAAKIDGAGEFAIYTKIYLPLSTPLLATLTILTVMSEWNSLMWPLLMLTKSDMFTIALGTAFFSIGEIERPLIGNGLAIATMSVLPVVIIYLFLQKYIVQSVALSGVKQ